MTVAGLLLAAGAGRRLGGPKALVEVEGEPLVRRGIRLLVEGGCDPVVVVVGAQGEAVRALVIGSEVVAEVVQATDWDTGMGASLQAGLAHLSTLPGVQSCVVALVDQPLVTSVVVERLLATGGTAVVAAYDGRPRNPVLLDRSVWPGVSAAAVGDEGARGWLRAHPELVTAVDCTDVGAPDDVDTPADLEAMLALLSLSHATTAPKEFE